MVSTAINIDVPVQIRPRYLVYVSPWDIKIAEETTGPSSLRIEPSGVKSDKIPALWEEMFAAGQQRSSLG